MPEGDVVLRTARRLDAALSGRELLASDFRWPSLALTDLSGREVITTISRGKHLLTRFSGGLTLHSHLRMEGSWHLHRTGEPWRQARDRDGIRVILTGPEWTAIGHRLGELDLLPTDREDEHVGHLGPDLLGPDWDLDRALARLASDPGRAVGEALLDQRVMAGIGTFYLAETLFLKGLTPWTPVGELADPEGIVKLARKLLTVNSGRAVQVTTGNARDGQREFVHSRSGRPCRRCGTTIRVASIGRAPQDRVVFFCPSCQRGPTPTDDGRVQRPLGAGRVRRRSSGSS